MNLNVLKEKKEKKVMYNSKYFNFYSLILEHLIGSRLHFGHSFLYSNKKINSYALGIQDKVIIFDLERSWFFLRNFYYILLWSSSKRISFFLIATNKNLSNSFLGERLNKKIITQDQNLKNFDLIGFMHGKWIGGVLSNWIVINKFLKMIKKKYNVKHNKLSKRYLKIFKNFQGLWSRKYYPSFPDIVLLVDGNMDAIYEVESLKIPLMGLIDSNIHPSYFSLGFLGNDDSIDSIEFFFNLIDNALYEGRKKEQEIFYYMLLKKVQNLI